MGDRGHIKIEMPGDNDPVYLYTHWDASGLPAILANALAHEQRWGDSEYLARIILDELSEQTTREFTGCGIGTAVHGDAWRVISVEVNEQEVFFEPENGYRDDPRAGERYSFEEFVESELGATVGDKS